MVATTFVTEAVAEQSLVQHAKLALFGVFHSMRERDSSHRLTARGQMWALVLRIIDAMQVLVLALNPEFGWSSSLLSWMDSFSLLNILLPNHDPALFNVVYVAVVAIVSVALVDAAYVAYMFKNSSFKHLWALKLLRFMVSLLVTAGFVPTFGILITPFSCSTMRQYNGEDFSCASFHRVGFIVLSAIVLALFIPFGLAASLVFHDSDGNSAALSAKVSGREAMFGTVAKLLSVVGKILAPHSPALVTATMAVMYISIATYVTMTLPFFHRFMNQFRVASSVLVASVAVGGLLMALVGKSSAFSMSWMAVSVMTASASTLLPVWRMRVLVAKLMKMRPVMLEELASGHAAVPTDWTTKRGSFRSVKHGDAAHQRRARRVSISMLADRVREARFRKARLPLSDLDEVLAHGDGDIPEKTVFDGMSAYEVELVVRAELAQPGNTDKTKKRRRFGKKVPTTQAVEHALWLFVQAIDEFCDDPVDIANVKIEYARFLQVFTADVNLATSALDSAKKDMPSLEGEFEVFTRMRGLQQKRQSQSLGAERDMNLIALVEYSKRITSALDQHRSALRAQRRMFKLIKRLKPRLVEDDDVAAERIGVLIEKLSDSTQQANRLYRRLLVTHPTAPHLGSIYNRFATDVLNDELLASQFGNDDDGHSAGGGSAAGGSAGGSAAGSLGRSSKGYSIGSRLHGTSVNAMLTMRSMVPRTRTSEVSFLETQFRCGTLILLILAVAMFVTTRTVLSNTSDDVTFLATAGVQRSLCVTSAKWARTLQLEAPNVSATVAEDMLADMRNLKSLVHEVYRDGSQQDDVMWRWNNPSVPVRVYAGNSTWYDQNVNLFDAANRIVADMHALHDGGYDTVLENPHFRFVFDNAVTRVLPAFLQLLDRMQDAVSSHIILYTQLQAALFVILVITLFVLGQHVFRRALDRVSKIKRGVNQVALALEDEDIEAIIERATNGLVFVAKAREVATTAEGEMDLEEGPSIGPGTRGRRPSVTFAGTPYDRAADGRRGSFPDALPGAGATADRGAARRWSTGVNMTERVAAVTLDDGGMVTQLSRAHNFGSAASPSTASSVPFTASPRLSSAHPHPLGVGTTPGSSEWLDHSHSSDGNSDSADEGTEHDIQRLVTRMSSDLGSPRQGRGSDSSLSTASLSGSGHNTEQVAHGRSSSSSRLDDHEERKTPSTVQADTIIIITGGDASASTDGSGSADTTYRASTDINANEEFAAADVSDQDASTSPTMNDRDTSTSPTINDRDTSTSPTINDRHESTSPTINDCDESKASATTEGKEQTLSGINPIATASTAQLLMVADGDGAGHVAEDGYRQSDSDSDSECDSDGGLGAMDSTVNLLSLVSDVGDEDLMSDSDGDGDGDTNDECDGPAVASVVEPDTDAVVDDGNESASSPRSEDDIAANPLAVSAPTQQPTVQAAALDGVEYVTRATDGEQVAVPSLLDIFEAAPGCVAAADATGTLVHINGHFTRLLGYGRRKALGAKLNLFVDPEQLKVQQKLIRRLILTGSLEDGSGSSEVRDGQGQQIDVVAESGETLPVLLNMKRITVGRRYFVVLDLQDLRNHISQNHDDDEDDQSDTSSASKRSSNASLIRQVVSALILVGILQTVNVVVGLFGLEEISSRAVELNSAGKLRMLSSHMAFVGREAVIGDGQLYNNSEAVAVLSATLAEFEQRRYGLMFGDASLDLPGAVHRNQQLDELQFGSRLTPTTFHVGLVAEGTWVARAVHDIIRDFGISGVGASPASLAAVPALSELLYHDTGDFAANTASAVHLFSDDSEQTTDAIHTTDLVIASVHVCLVIALYFVVFHRMVAVLIRQARRTEGILLALPESIASSSKLAQHYTQADPNAAG